MNLHTEEDGLVLFDLDLQMTGYRRFISCWLYQREGLTFVVDPGPRASAEQLVEALYAHGVDHLDFVLLTHIHLDHGGGSAEVLGAYPEARLYCHRIGVPHLQAPERLWAGSKATLGPVAEAYGEPAPVAADRLVRASDLLDRGIEVVDTPGHAPHHVSFFVGDLLFAGEAVATCERLADGRPYLRPATPPKFLPEVFLRSLAVLEARASRVRKVAFAHHGASSDLRHWSRLAREQLVLWLDTLRALPDDADRSPEALFDRVSAADSVFSHGFEGLEPDIQERERYYVGNSLKGMLQHLAEGQA